VKKHLPDEGGHISRVEELNRNPADIVKFTEPSRQCLVKTCSVL